MRLVTGLIAGTVALAAPAVAQAADGAAPRRVVSLNVCTDQIALMLAAPGQIEAVSRFAVDPKASVMVEEARAYPTTAGGAEDVFLRRPDLVLAGSYTARATVDILRRLGIPVVEIAPASGFGDIAASIREIGAALGAADRAEEVIARFEARLARVPAAERTLRVALYGANGYTEGAGTLSHEVVTAAGFSNIAAEIGIVGIARLSLEQLILADPDLIVIGLDYDSPARAQEIFSHPALAALADVPKARIAPAHWVCGTPHIVEAVEGLVEARDAILEGR